jgi:XRE family transcriptional regulator, stress-response regulator
VTGTNPTGTGVLVVSESEKNFCHVFRCEETAMTTLLREVIGDVLRQARLSQGRTLREVSDGARVSLGYLSEVERGRKEASSELLSAICGALEVPLSRVLSDAGESMERLEQAAPRPIAAASAANIDRSTRVVIPQTVSMAVA